jgi:hypothetical protein
MTEKKLPKQLLVYRWVGWVDGKEEYLTAVQKIDEIPEDQDGVTVGVYELKAVHKLKMTRQLT